MVTAWTEEEDALVTFADETAKEWWGLRVVDDRQYIALLELIHEMRIRTYYEWRRDEDG